jgi:hypothetical protein
MVPLTLPSRYLVETNAYGGANSAINAVSLKNSSFGHRDKLLTFQLYASSSTYGNPYPDTGVTFVQGYVLFFFLSVPLLTFIFVTAACLTPSSTV